MRRSDLVAFNDVAQLPARHDVGDAAVLLHTANNDLGHEFAVAAHEHFAVIHFGTDSKDLSQIAKSHIRLNRTHAETIFRVRVDDLQPQTTYYYWVTSMEADGVSDPVQSPVGQFTTPAHDEVFLAYPQPQ